MTTATETKTLTSLTVIVREWFDKTYGNTYYSARVIANGEIAAVFPLAYGHGELTVLNRANGVLRESGYQVPQGPAWDADGAYHQEYREAGVPLVIDITTVTRRKDLHK